ncbi:MAG: hypothetical protein GF364_14255 [Candidatus Lokiarchaeota archaeon]|nr:hypothetical protein [Candidatus Lokiarchaeota archaeon]
MSLDDADDILEDDIKEIEAIEEHYNKTKNINDLLHMAQKCNNLADLYYEAMQRFNSRYYTYKIKASEYYEKIGRSAPTPEIRLNSKLLSILLLIQASKLETAEKKLNLLRRKQELNKNTEISEDWLYIIELLLIPSLKEAKKRLRYFKPEMDNSLYKFYQKTIDIIKLWDKEK